MSFSKSICLVLCVSFVSANFAAADDNIKSVYAVSKKVKGTQADAEAIQSGKMETIEERFHLDEARSRGGTYYEIIHHVPGQNDELMCSVNYDDYQYTSGLLKKDADQLWGKWVNVRNGASAISAFGSLYLMYGVAAWVSKKKIYAVSAIAEKAVTLSKSTLGIATVVGMTYVKWKEILNFYNEIWDQGKFVPYWEGFHGREVAERAWLTSVISQSYENAMYDTPIDETQFDIDATFNRVQATLSGKKVDAPKSDEEKKAAAAALPKKAIATVPMEKDFSFAVTAFHNYCKSYIQDNVEDTTEPTPSLIK